MTVSLQVSPEISVPWRWFLHKWPAYSIALDGFVEEAPRYSDAGPHLNLNHHQNVDRSATRATCAQTLMAIRQGLFKRFQQNGEPHATVYVNDCDEDVSVSWFLLSHPAMAVQILNPLLNRLVSMEDALDATAGAYPFPPDLPVIGELAWVFEPYRQFRVSGRLDARIASEYRSIIQDVCGRIEKHITGTGSRVPLDTRYERLGGGTGWTMVKEIGAQARTGMFAEGIRAYVTVRERPDHNYTYVLGRMSPFVPFNLKRIYEACNNAENRKVDVWGGSDLVGGSPRQHGSTLRPEELTCLIEETLKADNS